MGANQANQANHEVPPVAPAAPAAANPVEIPNNNNNNIVNPADIQANRPDISEASINRHTNHVNVPSDVTYDSKGYMVDETHSARNFPKFYVVVSKDDLAIMKTPSDSGEVLRTVKLVSSG